MDQKREILSILETLKKPDLEDEGLGKQKKQVNLERDLNEVEHQKKRSPSFLRSMRKKDEHLI